MLPGFGEQVQAELAAQLLDQRDHCITCSDHHQHTRPPGTEAGEKAKEGAKCFVGPHIDRALSWKHEAKLSGDDSARDEECKETQDPVNKGGCTGARDNTCITDEKDDGHEDSHHIEGIQDLGENTASDPFGA